MIEHSLNFYRCESNLLFSWLCTEMPQSLTEQVRKEMTVYFILLLLYGDNVAYCTLHLLIILPIVINLFLSRIL